MMIAGSLYVSYRHRRPCILEYEDGVWLHHYQNATLADTRIRENPPTLEKYEKHTHDVFFPHYTPGEGDVVIDVGAGVGTETLVISKLVGETGLVCAIEAHPVVFSCLEKICKHNSLENAQVFQIAFGDAPGEINMSDDLSQHISNHIFSEPKGSVPVKVETIDSWLESQAIESIDLLKMNIEGAEKLVLSAAERTLAKTHNVAISCHDFKAERTGDPQFRTRDFVYAALKDAGFELFTRPEDSRPWVRDTIYGSRG